ncbi:MAG: DNA polymerase III subunit alpha [Candidatus Shikimatogenerans bostrichidophilus]|nr:MAG: DNA polymerase III subunit alpha [Candidatus Shikimatogenerans bostrichidophilus]
MNELINKALKYKMKAVGIIDDNLMGSYNFINELNNVNLVKEKIKGIIGCEIKVINKKKQEIDYILIAKNKIGYYNLIKLSYYSYINKNEIYIIKKIKKYKEGLIFLTGGYNTNIYNYLIRNKIKKAQYILSYWKKIFKDDIYIEIFNNKLKYQNKVNNYLVYLSKKINILYINQNKTYFLNKKDYILHNILLCIKNKEIIYKPISFYKKKKGYRYGLPNNSFYFKKYDTIKKSFKRYKKGFKNLNLLLKKIKNINLENNKKLPDKFNLPKSFYKKNKNKKEINYLYLKYLTYKGAKKKYGKLKKKIIKRIKIELSLIKKKKFVNYFLIVNNIKNIAKKLKIYIGPGRGSVAGSIIAYSLNITRIDPLKYNLLFERFLNIYREKMPDIDLDLDYKKRKKINLYLINKYGKDKVCHIVTHGKIGIKTAIKDCGRVFNIPLKIVNKISKIYIEKKNINIFYNKKLIILIFKLASKITGLIRNIGIHACGIIISNKKLINNIPLMLLPFKNYNVKNLLLSQFDVKAIEGLGLLKIDLLGLKTLTIIKETKKKIKKKIKFSLHDKDTYNLFKGSETIGVFQYESIGIQSFIGQLKPKKFIDLIAFNALYRPGPIKNIPKYIKRKNGLEKVTYDLPIMENLLKETYGITIYQEQVILLANLISGIDENKADLLREAIAKKNTNALKIFKEDFYKGALNKGYNIKILNKIWRDWESFASYAFNKSHATCYAYISFKSAFLKKHYPIEYLSSLLNNSLDNSKKHKKFLNEVKRIKIKFLLPDINKSKGTYIIENNKIRYGFRGIKGIGEKVSNSILKSRYNKDFSSIWDFLYRNDLRIVNKRIVQILIKTGNFDNWGIPREQYFLKSKKDPKLNLIELIMKNISLLKKQKYSYLYIKKKIKKYLKNKNKINDIELIKNLKEEKENLGLLISKKPYYIENRVFNIINLKQYKLNIYFEKKIILIRGFIFNIKIINNKCYILFIDYKISDLTKIKKFFILLNLAKYYKIIKNNRNMFFVIKYNIEKKKIFDIYLLKDMFNYFKTIKLILFSNKKEINLIKEIKNILELPIKEKKIIYKDVKFIIKNNNFIIYEKLYKNLKIKKKNLYFLTIKYPNIKIVFLK